VERGGRDAIRGSGKPAPQLSESHAVNERKRYFTSQVSPARRVWRDRRTALGDDGLDLFVHDIFVAWDVAPGTEDADRSGKIGRPSMWESWKA